MVSEISGPIDGPIKRAEQDSDKVATPPTVADAQRSAQPAADTASLADRAAALQSLEAAVANTPEVEHARVEALSKAIADGSYEVDPAKIADKLIELESQLPLEDDSE